MEHDEFTKKILFTIKEKQVSPTPRWFFIVKEYILLVALIITLLITASSIGILIAFLSHQEWFAIAQLDDGIIVHSLRIIPYTIVFIAAIVLSIAITMVRFIRKGYRIPLSVVIIGSISISSTLAFLLFFSGIPQTIHKWLFTHIPSYQTLYDTDEPLWDHPEQGLLTGTIMSYTQPTLTLIDDHDIAWVVTIPETLAHHPLLTPKTSIKIIGTMEYGTRFIAKELFAVPSN